jgi:macrodomain Ter protein organizer (MatP/YcbG family)
VITLATRKQNITLDTEVFERFCDIAGRKGIKISTWINLKMKEFVEEEEAAEAAKKKHS